MSKNALPNTALNSPPPEAGMIIKTPLLVYFASITSFGIVITASNGWLPSANLVNKRFGDKKLIIKLSYFSSHLMLFTVKFEAP